MSPRGLLHNSALALLADAASKAGMLGVLVISGRMLPTSEFAVVAAALSASAILTALLDAGCQTLLAREGVAGPATRGALLRDLARARVPLALGVAAACLLVGGATGHLLEAALTVVLSVAGAGLLSLAGALRSAQDLRPEAIARLGSSVAGLGFAAAAAGTVRSASGVLAALTFATLAGFVLLAVATRRAASPGAGSQLSLLRDAIPLGVIALATLAYYRSGALALSALSTAEETALFAAASTLGFGLLALANAVTTALIPRIAADADPRTRSVTLRRTVAWTTAAAVALATLTAVLAPLLLSVVFGPGFREAGPALAVLAVASVPIAVSGVLGAGLVAVGQLRPIAVQVALSLSINVGVLVLLVPRAGAMGAAFATLACELVAVAVLLPAAVRAFPGLRRTAARSSPALVPLR